MNHITTNPHNTYTTATNGEIISCVRLPNIFIQKINNKHKIIPLNITRNTLGPTKHFPPATQEWSNSIYTYNNNSMKNTSIADQNLTRLIKSYFNLHLNKKSLKKLKNKFKSKRVPTRFKRLSFNKIFISKAELKHTNSKVIVTVYVYNEERRILVSNLKNIEKDLSYKKWIPISYYSKFDHIEGIGLSIDNNIFEKGKFKIDLLKSKNLYDFLLSYNPPLSLKDKIKYYNEDFLVRLKFILSLQNKMEFLNEFISRISFKDLLDIYETMMIKEVLSDKETVKKNRMKRFKGKRLTAKQVKIIENNIIKLNTKVGKLNKFRALFESNTLLYENINSEIYPRFVLERVFLAKEYKEIFKNKYLLSLNQNKFKPEYLSRLKALVEGIYNKQVEFNFVNLKNLYLNSNIFVQAISTKLKNRDNKLLRVLRSSVRMVKLPNVNRIRERYLSIDINQLWANKIKNLNVNTFIAKPTSSTAKDALDQLILNLLPVTHNTSKSVSETTAQELVQWEQERTDIIQGTVLNSLKYKSMAGVRLEARGRLTKRFTASRSVFKLKWKGGLKNIDSSFRGLSSVILRGHVKPNVQYTLINSKTRNGAFGLKGWIAGK